MSDTTLKKKRRRSPRPDDADKKVHKKSKVNKTKTNENTKKSKSDCDEKRITEGKASRKRRRQVDLEFHHFINNFDTFFPQEEEARHGEENEEKKNHKKRKKSTVLPPAVGASLFPASAAPVDFQAELEQFQSDPQSFHVKDYNLAEIHGVVTQGVATAAVPGTSNNAAPRVSYANHHMKATIAMPDKETENHKTSYQLCYPERPLVGTALSEMLGLHRIPAGINCMVAILPYYESNEEDSLLLKKQAIDRGLFLSIRHHQLHTSESHRGSTRTIGRVRLDECFGVKKGDYSQLDSDGIIRVGAQAHPDCILVQQTTPLRCTSSGRKYRDSSLQMNSSDYGTVDRVTVYSKEDGSKAVTIGTHRMHRPEDGDKFGSRHGQKSVCGCIVNEEDLPFDSNGVVPDACVNPHAFVSRQTYSQFFEGLLCLIACITGRVADGTPYSTRYRKCFGRAMETKIKDEKLNVLTELSRVFTELGLPPGGCSVMTSGITGRRMHGQVFHTPIHILALKHQAANKLRARPRGRININTWQPVPGQKKIGGIRAGEMEKDALAAHGAPGVVQDRLLYSSDFRYRHICAKCQYPCTYSDYQNKTTLCKNCGGALNTGLCIPASHSFKSWGDEIMACGMAFRYHVEAAPPPGSLPTIQSNMQIK